MNDTSTTDAAAGCKICGKHVHTYEIIEDDRFCLACYMNILQDKEPGYKVT